MMKYTNIAIKNIFKLVEETAVSESEVCRTTGLSRMFFSRLKKENAKLYFEDVCKVAMFFNKDLNYFANIGNAYDDLFIKHHKIKTRDIAVLTRAFEKLDDEGRAKMRQELNDELKQARMRAKKPKEK